MKGFEKMHYQQDPIIYAPRNRKEFYEICSSKDSFPSIVNADKYAAMPKEDFSKWIEKKYLMVENVSVDEVGVKKMVDDLMSDTSVCYIVLPNGSVIQKYSPLLGSSSVPLYEGNVLFPQESIGVVVINTDEQGGRSDSVHAKIIPYLRQQDIIIEKTVTNVHLPSRIADMQTFALNNLYSTLKQKIYIYDRLGYDTTDAALLILKIEMEFENRGLTLPDWSIPARREPFIINERVNDRRS